MRSPKSASRPTTTPPMSATSVAPSINSVIKSGANRFSGNAFEFYRNSDFDANTWENNRSGAAKQERTQHIFGGTIRRPYRPEQSLLLRRLPGLAPGRAWLRDRVGGARGLAPRRPVERRRPDPRSAHGPAVPRESDSCRSVQPDRARAAERPRRTIRCRTARCRAGYQATSSARRCWPSAPTRATCASTGARRTTTSSSAAIRLPPTKTAATSSRFRSSLPTRNDQPFYNVAFNWNRVFGSSLINELLVGYSNTTVVVETAGLGRHRRGERELFDRRRPADRRPQPDRMGQRAHAARGDRDRLGHAREDLSDQREGDVDQRPPHREVRRAVAALQPATFLRRQQRAARVHQLQRRVHRLCVLGLPARHGVEQGPGRRRSRTIRGRTCRIASRVFAQDDFKILEHAHAEPGSALGLHLAARRGGQSAVELRSRHRPPDLRRRREHRRARALQPLLQRLRAARRRRMDAPPIAS